VLRRFVRLRLRTAGGGAAFLLALALSGCASVQRDIAMTSAGEADFARLAALEGELPLLLAAPDAARLGRDRAAVAGLRSSAPLNATYRARAAALAGELALLGGDSQAAAYALSDARAAQSNEESVYLLRSRLEASSQRREAILLEGMKVAASSSLLRAELGEALYAQGRYREAVAAFDQVLASLPVAWRSYYSRDRGAAIARMGGEGGPAEVTELLGRATISLSDMASIVQGTTSLLDFLTGGATWAQGPLFERLQAGGFFGPNATSAADQATRARAAYFLWKLIVAKEDDPRLADSYSVRYAARSDAASPVPDAPIASWYFDAALGCVEREVLALPDGRNFFPDLAISGSDFGAAARAAANLD